MAAPALNVFVQGQGAATADNLNTFEQTCVSVAQLRAFVGARGVQVSLRGITTPGDGGAGTFFWSASSTAADDGVNTIVPSGNAQGAWIRLAGMTKPGASVTGASTPTISSGSGAPSINQPNSSLYLNLTGATGSRLYVSTGSGWNAVSGV